MGEILSNTFCKSQIDDVSEYLKKRKKKHTRVPYSASPRIKQLLVKRIVIIVQLNYSIICDRLGCSDAGGSEAAGQIRTLRMWNYRFMLVYT